MEYNHYSIKFVYPIKSYKRLEDEKEESYNLFKVIDMTSNETSVHSAFLADLFNPKGLHHMGDVFLKLFIDEFLNGIFFPPILP